MVQESSTDDSLTLQVSSIVHDAGVEADSVPTELLTPRLNIADSTAPEACSAPRNTHIILFSTMR